MLPPSAFPVADGKRAGVMDDAAKGAAGAAARAGRMSLEEARNVLGVEAGAPLPAVYKVGTCAVRHPQLEAVSLNLLVDALPLLGSLIVFPLPPRMVQRYQHLFEANERVGS